MSKRISVCMATYNGASFIKEQLESILTNLADDDEVIISDDHSTDDTLKIVASFNDPRIKTHLNNPKNKGHIGNFGNAMKKASGAYIFLADQDDVWHPDRIAIVLEALQKNELVVCDCWVTDGKLQIINDSFYGIINAGSGFVKNWVKNTYLGCCMAFHRSIMEKALPFPKNIVSHDTWVGLMGEIYGTTVFIPQKLHYFRRHGTNFSQNDAGDAMSEQKSPYSLMQKIKIRLVLGIEILKRIVKNG
ncbi:glycosyltransferase family 2 protein [Maribacter algicola]|uniref:Glycosyltransferase family 2 protein n=1 Tax=Meishania litoralis TaxID=3434685 RepID=A0ACC7LIJ2_9FLAO